jgi:hypothetical protein
MMDRDRDLRWLHKQPAVVVAVLVALFFASSACDGPHTRDYVIEVDEAAWAVPLTPYPDRLNFYAGNEARWVPARPTDDELDDEQPLYTVSTIAGLNEVPQHPVAVFRPGFEWVLLCPQSSEHIEKHQPEAAEACRSVTEFETGSVWTGGAWHGRAKVNVDLSKHALEQPHSPAVTCRGGDDGASATCEAEVSAPALEACSVKMVRLWGPGEVDSHSATVEVSADTKDGTSVLAWPLFPGDWIPENLRESVAEKRRRDVPPNSFALLSCQSVDEEQIRFVGAPVVVTQ